MAVAPSAAAQQLPDPDPTAGDPGAEAERILAGAEFAPDEPDLLDRITGWIGDRIASLFDQLGGAGGQVFAWVLLCGAAGLIVFFIVRGLRNTGLGGPDDASAPTLVFEEEVSLDELREAAERAELEGDWKAALLSRYRILVAELIERDKIDNVAGRTTGEYRTEVERSSPGSAVAFAEATTLFEAAWYGDEPTGADENRRFRGLTDEVLGAVPA